ncbi:uncharacterized protein LOC107361049 isoform X2 [Tetranychus urticae]|uniref:uncharacterized protein LOC107361049 isoform X2 n=1 Tax=Tetranychus urticae TaxID=32264 RepID=UPI00077B93FF|nr:uncharacterized protein LOC107361049 isoform X2 [Tetranychus urticae]
MNSTFNSSESHSLVEGFSQALLIVTVSELGDKTFIITAIMAMKYPKHYILIGALSAEYIMVTFSLLLGLATSMVPQTIIHYISIILFFIIGVTMIYEGIAWKDNSDHNDNIINKDNNSNAINNSNNNDKNDNNVGVLMENRLASTAANNNAPNETRKFWFKNSIAKHESFVIIEMFTMVFIAEWADKSQLAVIILTAQQNKLGVALGAFVAQTFCMIVAVISALIFGGLTFIAFSIYTTLRGTN